jgi:hypothetical protein
LHVSGGQICGCSFLCQKEVQLKKEIEEDEKRERETMEITMERLYWANRQAERAQVSREEPVENQRSIKRQIGAFFFSSFMW